MNSDGEWGCCSRARNLLMGLDDRGQRPALLIHDLDRKFSRAFDAIFRATGSR